MDTSASKLLTNCQLFRKYGSHPTGGSWKMERQFIPSGQQPPKQRNKHSEWISSLIKLINEEYERYNNSGPPVQEVDPEFGIFLK